MKPLTFLLALCAVVARAQQQADPEFKAVVARPAFVREHPRVLFDEAHNNVHGLSNRYKAFGELLANDGYDVQANKLPFSAESLKDARVLVIANARGKRGGFATESERAFTYEECNAVRDWVAGGGSLLLIADHAPMGSANELLAARFGVQMSKGYVEDMKHTIEGPEGDQGGTIVFSRENGLLKDHPITNGRNRGERVNVVMSFTGQAVKGPAWSAPFMQLADTAADRPARLLPPQPGDPPGRSRIDIGEPVTLTGWAQGVAMSFGRGRVVVLGEAGMLSAQITKPTAEQAAKGQQTIKFGMNKPGVDNKQLALNILHWLSGLL
ncbi:MAG: hypothetical protein QOJ65_710 [Fimbriimonadaceae bacterium]|nr:hypothetical protein [Fimbriimonadaceae bacterium]